MANSIDASGDAVQGYIYILLNASLPGIVKIGKTCRTPEDRASELSSTGLPTPFVVAYAQEVSDCHEAESMIHEVLAEDRVSSNREFFRVSTKEAIQVVADICSDFPVGGPAESSLEIANSGMPAEPPLPTGRIILKAVAIPETAPPAFSPRSDQRPPDSETRKPLPAISVADLATIEPRFRTVERVSLRCASCQTDYSVTMRRYELGATCPACLSHHAVPISW